MAVTYYALLTTLGAGKLANAAALGTTLKITQLAVGDGGGSTPTPDAGRTALVNEVRRAPLNQLSVDPANAAQIIAEQVIPEDVGGWWIRELGLYDDSGTLIAYANCAPSYKPQLAEGSGRTQTVRLVLIVSNTASVELKIDPSVVLATRDYVDSAIVSAMNKLDQKQSVRAATTANITLSGLQTLDGVALAAGDRVLVKNQTNVPDNGLYLAASGAWKRAADADQSVEVTPNLIVAVEEGTAQADSIWQLTSNAPIVLGTTALVFQNITTGLAPLASPVFTGNPTAPTPALFDSDTSVATTAFVQRALGGRVGQVNYNANTTLTASDVGKLIVINASVTVTLPLASTVPDGSLIALRIGASTTVTVIKQGSDSLLDMNGYAGPFALVGGCLAIFRPFPGGIGWELMEGDAALRGSSSFSAGITANGFQKLPSGLIIQWGIVPIGYGGTAATTGGTAARNSFPIPFPNGCFAVNLTHTGNVPITVTAMIVSKTQFDAFSNYSQSGAYALMIAIGF